MKKLLLAAVAMLALAAPASAELITLNAFVDGILVNTSSSAGSLDVVNQTFGVFNLNTLTINDELTLAPPNILNTNTLNVNASAGGNHQLVLDITAFGLIGPNALTGVLNEFSVTGLTTGWNAQEQTYINGVLQADTGVFTANSASADLTSLALLGTLFNAEVKYTINSVGIGGFNGGIDMTAVSAVPLPAAGWLFGSALVGLGALSRRRKGKVAELAAA